MIALEDAKSARLYFESFRRYLGSQRLDIVIAPHSRANPKSVVEAAKAAKNARDVDSKKGLADPFEEVWVVFDTEGPQNRPRLRQARDAIEQARQLRFKTAVSNPAFEYWLLLHFENYVGQLADGRAVVARLKKYIEDYGKSRDCYAQTREHQDTALRNSKRVYELAFPKEHPCDCHPSTQVYRLVESLLGRG